MTSRWTMVAGMILVSFLVSPLSAQQRAQRGAVLGGLAGAAAGAAIGDHNDKAGAGALIGGALGVITGAALGNSADQEQARAQAYYQQQQIQQTRRAVSLVDVVTMTRNGVGDAIIINHIQRNGVQQRIQVADVIALHKEGVSEPVISALQQSTPAAYAPAPPVRYSRSPVVVEEYHYVAPPVYRHYVPRYAYPRHHHHHHHSGWSFRIGN